MGSSKKEILEIIRQERDRIAQEVHDGLSQDLTVIALKGRILEQKLTKKSLPEAVDAKKLLELVNKAITDLHHLVRELGE